MKQIRRKKLSSALIQALGAGVALSVAATAADAQQTAQRTEKIEVTGSNIKRVDQEGPSPVTVIRREDIQRSAGQNLVDVLNTLPVANLGSSSETRQSGNSFAPGTSQISLRGLGAQTTLVLLNGRRVANYGFAQNVNEAFVDLNSIPVSAIERIEILKEGASAIYGSDAIAGVVNIILRKDFTGVEISGGLGTSQERDADETRASLTAGFGDLSRNRFNVMATLDYYKRDPLFGSDRERSRTADYRRFYGGIDFRSPTGNPGTFLTAASTIPAAQRLPRNTPFPTCSAEALDQALDPLGTCAYNFMADVMILPETERKGVFGRGVLDITSNLQAFLEAGFNRNSSFRQLAPTPDALTLPAGHPSNPYPFAVGIRYRFTDVGPRLDEAISETTRMVAGLRGNFGRWDWEAAYVYAKNEIENTGFNYIPIARRNALIAGRQYNFVNNAANDPALVAGLRYSPTRIGESEMKSADVKVSGSLMELPGGSLGLAVGAERREESVLDRPDPLSALGQIIGSGGTAAAGERTANGFFAELSVPILRNLEAQIAVRHERYSDYGTSTVPKYAMAFRATPNMMFRAGYSEGFRAPALAELYLGQSISFQAAVDTPRCNAYRAAFGTTDPRSTAACASLQIRGLIGGNPDLTAETSENYNIGMVWDITPRLSTAFDVYQINHKQRIDTPTAAFIINNPDQFPGSVTRDPQTANDIIAGSLGPIVGTASDERIGIRRVYFNASQQKTRGIDWEMRYRIPMGASGQLSLNTLNTYVDYFRRAVAPNAPLSELAGRDRFPRYRGVHSAVWTTGAWETVLTYNLVGSYFQVNQPITGVNLKVDKWHTFDFQASFTGIKNLRLTAGVRNLTDEDPPFYNNESSGGYDTFTHSIIGRFYYARATFSFR